MVISSNPLGLQPLPLYFPCVKHMGRKCYPLRVLLLRHKNIRNIFFVYEILLSLLSLCLRKIIRREVGYAIVLCPRYLRRGDNTCGARVEGLYAPKYNNPVRVPQARSAGVGIPPTPASGRRESHKIPSFRRLSRVGDDTPHFATRYARRLVRGYSFSLLTELRPVLRTLLYVPFVLLSIKNPMARSFVTSVLMSIKPPQA